MKRLIGLFTISALMTFFISGCGEQPEKKADSTVTVNVQKDDAQKPAEPAAEPAVQPAAEPAADH